MKKSKNESLSPSTEGDDPISPAPVGYLLHGSDKVVRMMLTEAANATVWRARGETVEELFSASQIEVIRGDLARLADLEARIENAHMAASETQPSWKHRCYAILGALGADYGDPDWIMPGERRKLEAALARVAELEGKLQEKAMGQDEVERLLGLEKDLRHCAVVFETAFGEDGGWHVRSIGSYGLISTHVTRWDAISAAALFDCKAEA
ncbi:hypothetical protein D3C71_190010 [compost metagenome]